MYDVIIIGGGPAGLTAALYSSRARLKVLLLEDLSLPAQITLTDKIENYPGFIEGIMGFELIDKIKKQVEKIGAEFFQGSVKNIQKDTQGWKVITKNGTYNCLSLIVASGTKPKKLGVVGEDKFSGKGVSYCATCDGPFFKDKDIAVIGGGNSAVEEALFLTRFVRKIFLIHRRNRLRATKILQEKAFANKKIKFIWDSTVNEILGSEKVEAVQTTNIKTNKKTELSCDGVFIFTGHLPNTNFVKEIVELDQSGYIISNENMETSQKGIFVCGDCRKKMLRQVITACADGAIAAFSAGQYVDKKNP